MGLSLKFWIINWGGCLVMTLFFAVMKPHRQLNWVAVIIYGTMFLTCLFQYYRTKKGKPMSTMQSLIFVLFIAWVSTTIAFIFAGMSWFWGVGFLIAFLVAAAIHGSNLQKEALEAEKEAYLKGLHSDRLKTPDKKK